MACNSGDSAEPAPAPPAARVCERTDRDDVPAPERFTPRWAFEPWISKDISTRVDTYEFVDGFKTRGIPVGAVVLDSPWETSYNTFVPSPSRYPDMPGLIRDMHERGVRVVFWITSLVNETSFDFEPGGDAYSGPAPNLAEGLECNYFVDEGTTYGWWKGRGASVDFFNPDARAWWHRLQDPMLQAGLDGWKLDFGESYLYVDSVRTYEGTKPLQEYSERYYEDFLSYGRMKNGREFVTMVRAWDESYDFKGRFFAKKEHAPVAWMGDNRRDWIGLADALDHMFVSARAGYPVVGSDIGGYLDRDDKNLLGPQIPFDTLNFARWIAAGALTPFMQLHGRANLTPWTVPDHVDETVAIYKYWATLHHALVPFFFSLAEEAHASPTPASIVVPIGEPATWPNDYRWMLGNAFLVAPILDATGKRDVALPGGAKWIDWWTHASAEGGTTAAIDLSNDRLRHPLWLREGAIVPLQIENDVLGLGDVTSGDARTILVVPGATPSTFRLHEEEGIVTIGAKVEAGKTSITLSSAPKRTILRIHADAAPSAVSAPFRYDTTGRAIVVALAPSTAPVEVVVTP